MLRLAAAALLLAVACRSSKAAPDAGVFDPYARLQRLHPRLPKPGPDDWRARFEEPPQSFAQYRDVAWGAQRGRSTLYVVVLGDVPAAHARIIEQTTQLLSVYFSLKVKRLPDVPRAKIPDRAYRQHPVTDDVQLHTRWVLDELLPPLQPPDALALLAFTADDLFPDPDWNFVFGEAQPLEHTGVWSLARLGDPVTEPELVLRRTGKTAVHEAGHAFGLAHCAEALCVMNGANSLQEGDRAPMEPCPICLKKLQHAFHFDVTARFQRLCAFHTDAGLTAERAECLASLDALDAGR